MATDTSVTTAPPARESIPTIGREIVDDARRLVQLEIELAKAELVATVKRVAIGAGLLVLALVLLIIAAVYYIGSLPKNLLLLDHWWGWLVTGGALTILAAIVAFIGYRIVMRGVHTATAAAGTIKGDVEWARQLPSRRATSES